MRDIGPGGDWVPHVRPPVESLEHLVDDQRHAGVDAYIEALPEWQRDVCRELRDIVHEAVPGVQETIKRRVRPYFVLDGNVCALLATKDHVNLFLYDGGIVPDPHRIITGGHGNRTARTIAFFRDSPIPRQPLIEMLRQIADDNRNGGWRTITRG